MSWQGFFLFLASVFPILFFLYYTDLPYNTVSFDLNVSEKKRKIDEVIRSIHDKFDY